MVYSSTYRNVIEALKQGIESHPAVKTFRVGPPSTIEMPTDTKPEMKYPYVHLVPQPATLDGKSTVFDFDLIVMDLAKDQLGLEERTQSAMLEITRDIIAFYTNTTWEAWRFNIQLPVVSTPFVENFQNSVAGWTTQIKLVAITPLSNCENPVVGGAYVKPTFTQLAIGPGSTTRPTWVNEDIETALCYWNESADSYMDDIVYYQMGTTFEVGTKITNQNGRLSTIADGTYTVNISDPLNVPVPPIVADYSMITIVNGIVTSVTPFEDITLCAGPPSYDALVYTNTTTRTLSNTNAAFAFETEASDTNWFVGAAFSNYYGEKIAPFDAIISFDGTITYNEAFDPSLYQLAIYNREQDLFFGMTDLPLSGGAVSITSDIFQYLPAETDPFGDPVQEIQFLTLYEKGTANPIPAPPARFANPFTYNGTFKIKVNN
jgi:hypothetical protein